MLETKDYNKITRLVLKTGFSPRKISTMILVKSSLEHDFLKLSWRKIWLKYSIIHLSLYNFYYKFNETSEYLEIIEYLKERGVIYEI